MPQIFAVFGPSTGALLTEDEASALGEELVPVVERSFGIEGKKDVAFTGVRAMATEGEAAVQIEVRYTAGEDEYGKGKPFDPTKEEQEKVAVRIRRTFIIFLRAKGLPRYSLSVWCTPHYRSFFKSWPGEDG
jgi:hypothetical protein